MAKEKYRSRLYILFGIICKIRILKKYDKKYYIKGHRHSILEIIDEALYCSLCEYVAIFSHCDCEPQEIFSEDI